jgi:hypothetical protein
MDRTQFRRLVDGADIAREAGMASFLSGNEILDHYGLHAAPRDPVTLTIGIAAITAAETVTGIAIGFEFASAVGGIVLGGALIAANYALQKTVPDAGGVGGAEAGSSPATINTSEARSSIRRSTSPQRRVYGRMVTGGWWIFYDDATPENQYLTLGLARGRIEAVRACIINNKRFTFQDGARFNTILTPVAEDTQDFTGNLTCCFRQGLATQAKDPLLETYFPASGAEIVLDAGGTNVTHLPATYRQRGIATATFRAILGANRDVADKRWGHVPFIDPLIEIDGHPVFDPRDPTQNIDDESTYKFYYNGREPGRCPALIQCNWLTQPYGGRLRTDQIRLDELAAAADWDDGTVFDKHGAARVRHQADGVVLLNDNPRHVTEAMLTANRAWIVQSRGRVGWVPSAPLEPQITITERDLLGGFDYRDDTRKRDKFNRVRTRFPAPEKDYNEDDGPIVDRADLRAAEDDGEDLETTVRTSFTTDQRAVQWLSQQFLEDSRLGRALDIPSLPATPRILKCKIGTVVRVQMRRRYTEINGIYQIRQDGISDNFSGVSWSLRAYDTTIATKDRSTAELDFTVAEA